MTAEVIVTALRALPDDAQRVVLNLVIALGQRDRERFERSVTFLREQLLR